MGAFVDLPRELLLSIATFLKYSWDLNALSRVNHCFHDLLNPYLYRHKQQYSPSSTLLWAAEHGLQSIILKLLGQDQGITGNGQDSTWKSAVKLAAKHGHTPIVELLLDARPHPNLGKDLSALSDHLDYLLWVAAKEGHEALVQVLLKRGANPTTALPLEPNYPYPCLPQQSSSVAVAQGHLSVVKAIISSMGTSETLCDSFFLEDLLLLAASKGQSSILRYLLEKGASPCLRDSNGNHIMWHAAGYCFEHVIACLLEHGDDPNPSPSPRGSSAVKFALQGGKIPAVRVLLSKTFEGDSIPESHREPEFLCAAAACGSTDVMETLLRSGADPNAAVEDHRGMRTFKPEPNCTALRWAIGYNHESAIRLLLDAGAKPTPQALIDALRNSSVSIVELLLESGFDPNEFLENIGRHLSVARMNESLVRLLFERSPDPKIKTRRHTLTMIEALQAGQPDRVQLILDRGQRRELPEDYPSPSDLLDAATLGGLPTLELLFKNGYKVVREQGDCHAVLTAIQRHNPEALELLLQKNIGLPPSQPLASTVDSMLRNLYPNPPFFSHGTRESAQAILDLLLSHGFDIDSRPGKSLGKDGQTCLWTAIEGRDPVVTCILLDRGANPMLPGENDEMPLSAAVRLGFAQGVRMILEWFDTGNYGSITRSDWVALLSRAMFQAQSKKSWKIVRSLERFIYSHGLHFSVSVEVAKLAAEQTAKDLAEAEAAKSQPPFRPGQRLYRQGRNDPWRPVPRYGDAGHYDMIRPIQFKQVPLLGGMPWVRLGLE
ncbi:hypothetical protein ASPCAL09642 [Aspergillus calidoustus]|uniref:F-box domain-containing protein n=1 Tax=Aspergillus calidoustus TaxID=454130 RepID=A0A0U5G3K4_ASPCI|nr:hypothetical protein ASPCAL09642 [Aspergillus calidoustus]